MVVRISTDLNDYYLCFQTTGYGMKNDKFRKKILKKKFTVIHVSQPESAKKKNYKREKLKMYD